MTEDLVDMFKNTPRAHSIDESGYCARCRSYPEEIESDHCEPVKNRYLGAVGVREQQRIKDSNGWT